jgi:hypothetical protein
LNVFLKCLNSKPKMLTTIWQEQANRKIP